MHPFGSTLIILLRVMAINLPSAWFEVPPSRGGGTARYLFPIRSDGCLDHVALLHACVCSGTPKTTLRCICRGSCYCEKPRAKV
ncbi:hypothetical protein BJV74DRAFT_839890 [Russula compacta]|nr:hypothetical protein BJV74DRAFT_839890 [Russula compacta]